MGALIALFACTMCASPKVSRTDTQGAPAAETTTEPAEKSLLYKISGNGLVQDSYLYGTIHVICPADFELPAYVREAAAGSDITVLEMDMDEPDFQQSMQPLMFNPGMKNIADQMPAEERDELDRFLKKHYGAGIQQMGIMKPFILENLLLLKYLPCPEVKSYEEAFISISREQENEVIGLETVDFQFSIFDSIPQEEQIRWISDMMKDSAQTANEFARLVDAYKKKDVELLGKLAREDEQFDKYADLLLFRRNADWVPKIGQIASEQQAFIAVGAGHLGGEKGLITLLRNEGYTVTPITE